MKALVKVEAVKLSRSLGVFSCQSGCLLSFPDFSSTVQFDDATTQKPLSSPIC